MKITYWLLILTFSTTLAAEEVSVNALFQLVRNNDLKSVRSLSEQKVDVSRCDQWGANALFEVKSVEMAKLLVGQGADVNQQRIERTNRDTPLHIATMASNVPAMFQQK